MAAVTTAAVATIGVAHALLRAICPGRYARARPRAGGDEQDQESGRNDHAWARRLGRQPD